jgi:hypothetical protein
MRRSADPQDRGYCYSGLAGEWKRFSTPPPTKITMSGSGASRHQKTRNMSMADQYVVGSGESVGFSKALFIAGLIGMFRLTPFGGIGWVNHLA